MRTRFVARLGKAQAFVHNKLVPLSLLSERGRISKKHERYYGCPAAVVAEGQSNKVRQIGDERRGGVPARTGQNITPECRNQRFVNCDGLRQPRKRP